MKVIINKHITEDVDIVVGLTCNLCKGSLNYNDEQALPDPPIKMQDRDRKYNHFYGLTEASVSGGWHSKHLNDLSTYTFSLCEGCLVKLFDSFQIPPDVFSSVGGKSSWEEDRENRK